MRIRNSRDLLSSVYRSSHREKHRLESILDQQMDPALRQCIRDQAAELGKIELEARDLLDCRAWPARVQSGVMQKLTGTADQLRCMGRDKSSAIAAMVIRGSGRDMIRCSRDLHGYAREDPPVTGLAQRLVDTELTGIRNMQEFL